MARTFSYKMIDKDGQAQNGVIVAENEEAVAAHIREKGNYVAQISEKKHSAQNVFLAPFYRPKPKELAIFCKQFAAMTAAGIAVSDTLRILIEQSKNPRLKNVLSDVYLNVQRGEALSVSLNLHPAMFPPFMINMLFAAEESGTLDIMLDRLSLHFTKEHNLKQKIRSAMAYPVMVLIFLLFTAAFILIFAFPPLLAVFESMNMTLPWQTVILLETGSFVSEYYWYLLLAGLLCLGAVKTAAKNPLLLKTADKILFWFPRIGHLRKKIVIARFSHTLTALMQGGITIVRSLEIVKEIFPHSVMGDILAEARTSIARGNSLAAALGKSDFFPAMAVQMIAIGEKTGGLEVMLEKITLFYENDVEDSLATLNSLLGPLLVVLVGLVVGSIVVAVMMPLFEMMSVVVY